MGGGRKKKEDKKDNASIRSEESVQIVENVSVVPDVNTILQCADSGNSSIMSVPIHQDIAVRGRGRGRGRGVRQRGGRGSQSQPCSTQTFQMPAQPETLRGRGRGKRYLGRGTKSRPTSAEITAQQAGDDQVSSSSSVVEIPQVTQQERSSITTKVGQASQERVPEESSKTNVADPAGAPQSSLGKKSVSESMANVGKKVSNAFGSLLRKRRKALTPEAICEELQREIKEINKEPPMPGDFLEQQSSSDSDDKGDSLPEQVQTENAGRQEPRQDAADNHENVKGRDNGEERNTNLPEEMQTYAAEREADCEFTDADKFTATSDMNLESDDEESLASSNEEDINASQATTHLSSEDSAPPTSEAVAEAITKQPSLDSKRILESPRAMKILDRLSRDEAFVKKLSAKHWRCFPTTPQEPSEEYLQQLTVTEYKCSMGDDVKFQSDRERNQLNADDNVAFAWNALLANKGIDSFMVNWADGEVEIGFEEHMNIVETYDKIMDDEDNWEVYESSPEKFTLKKIFALSENLSEEDKQSITALFQQYQCSTLSQLQDLNTIISTEMLQSVGPWQGEPILDDIELSPKKVKQMVSDYIEAMSTSSIEKSNFDAKPYDLSSSSATGSVLTRQRPRSSTPQPHMTTTPRGQSTVTIVTTDLQEIQIPVYDAEQADQDDIEMVEENDDMEPMKAPSETDVDLPEQLEREQQLLDNLLNVSSSSIEKVESWFDSTLPKTMLSPTKFQVPELKKAPTPAKTLEDGAQTFSDSESSGPSTLFCQGLTRTHPSREREPKPAEGTQRRRRRASTSSSKSIVAPPSKTRTLSAVNEEGKPSESKSNEEHLTPPRIPNETEGETVQTPTASTNQANDKVTETQTQRSSQGNDDTDKTSKSSHHAEPEAETVLAENEEGNEEKSDMATPMDTNEVQEPSETKKRQERSESNERKEPCDMDVDNDKSEPKDVPLIRETLFDLEPEDMEATPAQSSICESLGTIRGRSRTPSESSVFESVGTREERTETPATENPQRDPNRPPPIVIKHGNQVQEIERSYNGQRRANPSHYNGIEIKRSPEELAAARAIPEIEKGKGLDKREIECLFERAETGRRLVQNNTLEMYMEPKDGDVYVFDLPLDQDIFAAKRALNNMDPYVWRNNGVGKTIRNIQKTYYRNDDYNGLPTDFEKRITISLPKKVAVVEYLNSHTTGKTWSDVNFEIAVKKYTSRQRQVEKRNNSMKKSKKADKVSKVTVVEPKKDERMMFDGAERETEVTFEQRLRSTLQPILPQGKMMREALPALTSVTPPGVALTPQQVEYLLERHTGQDFMDYKFYSICNPEDGQLYLFDVSQPSKTSFRKHINRDGYRWRSDYTTVANNCKYLVNQSSIKVLKDNGEVTSNANFKRFTFMGSSTQRVIVHYTGDNSVRARYKHLNSKHDRDFIPTSKRVEELLEEHKGEYTREILLKSRGQLSHGILQQLNEPRNANQVRYLNRKKEKAYKLTLTEKHNADVLADYWGDNVVRHLGTMPSTSCVIMTDHAVKELAKITSVHTTGSSPMVFHYDTTFNCGSHFVSTLSLRHSMLRHTNKARRLHGSGEPTIPIAFMIHDKRHLEIHEDFFNRIDSIMNKATNGEFRVTPRVVVSDLEFKEGVWDDVKVVHCWRHLSQNLERFVKTNGYTAEEGKQALNDFFKLARSDSEDTYKQTWERLTEEKKGIWASPHFVSYMRRTPGKSLVENAGQWYLEKLNMKNVDNGMTNNAAEGVNNALKSWLKIHQRQKRESNTEVEMYMVMQACKKYTDHEMIKVTRAYYNSSDEYRLSSKDKKQFQKPAAEMPPMPVETDEETIRNINAILNDHPYVGEEDPAIRDQKMNYTERKEIESRSQQALKESARDLLKTNKFMDFIPEGRYYKVIDEFDRPFTVYLNDNTCSCSTSGWCAHLLAVRERWGVGKDFEVPPHTVHRIPAPKHPSTLRKHRTGSKKPATQDTFNNMHTVKQKKSKAKVDHEQQLIQDRVSVSSAEEWQNSSKERSMSQHSSEQEVNEEANTIPIRVSKKYHKMTAEVAKDLSSYTRKERLTVMREEVERVKAIKEQRRAAAVAANATNANTPNQNQFATASAQWDLDYIDRRMDRQTFEHNHTKLQREEYTVVDLRGNKGTYAIRNSGNRTAVVYGKELDIEAMRFAARALQHEGDQINVEFYSTDNPVQDCELKLYDSKKTKLEVFTTQCQCREPVSMIEFSDPDIMMKCNEENCNMTMHRKCVNAVPSDFKCAMHNLPFPGMKWSAGKQTNTCPIDNFYTAVTMECIKNPDFQKAISKTKYTYPEGDAPRGLNIANNLFNAIEAAKAGNYGKAQGIHTKMLMHRYPELAPTLATNLEGTEQQMVWDLIKDGGAFYQREECTDCNYKTESNQNSQIHFMTGCYPPNLKFDLEHGGNETRKCPKCPSGIMGDTGLKIKDEKNPPWFMHLEVDTSAYRIREMNWLPKHINIGKEDYKLAYITLQTPNHFKAIINHEDQFLLYDGNKIEKFKWIPGNIMHQEYQECLIQGITYFRNMEH